MNITYYSACIAATALQNILKNILGKNHCKFETLQTTTYSFVYNAAKSKSLNKSLRDCIILYYTLIVFNDIVICYAHKVEWI